MLFLRRFRALALVFAVAAILVSGFAITSAPARPIHCPLCCMDIPFPPYYVCWHCCP
jgi:hypothetical protein